MTSADKYAELRAKTSAYAREIAVRRAGIRPARKPFEPCTGPCAAPAVPASTTAAPAATAALDPERLPS